MMHQIEEIVEEHIETYFRDIKILKIRSLRRTIFLGTESHLVKCLEGLNSYQEKTPYFHVQDTILYGSAIENVVRPVMQKRFLIMHRKCFIASQMLNASRIDVAWDEYHPDSLKAETRAKRGLGARRS